MLVEYLHGAIDLGQISVRYHLRRLVADADLESSRAPIDELNSALGLQGSNSTVYIVWHNVATVQKAGSHVFPVARITLHHLVVGLEASHRDFLNGVGFV